MMRFVAAIALIVSLTVTALAVEPDEVLDDPALEQRARTISAELRCLVCQNQSIDDSNAGLARDLRLLVRERLTEGDADDEVLDYIVARYGEYVLLRPEVGWHTLALWGAAPVILVVAGFVVLMWLRRRPAPTPGRGEMTEEERAALRSISEDDKRHG